MYEVIRRFQERFDDGREYNVGDEYPRKGFSPPPGRVDALCSGGISEMNANGAVFLRMAADKPRPRKKQAEGG